MVPRFNYGAYGLDRERQIEFLIFDNPETSVPDKKAGGAACLRSPLKPSLSRPIWVKSASGKCQGSDHDGCDARRGRI